MPTTLSPREILDRLVAFPTVSHDSNLPLIDWVEDYLTSHDIACHRVPDETGDKAALLAHTGPMIPGAVVLSGHTDVVPVEGQPWDTDPFTVTERAGRLYGRGTADMKGFDALAIWAMVEATSLDLKRPLQLALSYDEEVGCTGAPPMIDRLKDILPQGDTVIVGEPSMMQVTTGHKGSVGYHIKVKGFEVHSSLMHTGVSANMEAARIIQWINDCNVVSRAKSRDQVDGMFEPPWTTLHVGQIHGGTAHNITALDCWFSLDIRAVPGDSLADWDMRLREKVAAVQAGMQKIQTSSRIDVDRIYGIPGLRPENDGQAEALARRLTGDNASHVVSYGTEAGQFQERGYSAAICGPGNIEQAHQPNEFLAVSQFQAGEAFLRRLLTQLST